ncbi:hypothetical protein Vadar_003660 [Vaccinium darrowii]|uniref:Uncharacterized protein n=1 Tax=Vaccinium darrowii TaxID=229202 RepID=A0ACB7X7R5_9ERIC|nr:hypothetical protein Vadar_003660 [Vaccinium darrowii]
MDHMLCHCGKRSPVTTSWTDINPGRQFIGCYKYGSPDACNFFMWVDPPICARARAVIPGLLRRSRHLEDQIRVMKRGERIYMATLILFGIFFLWSICSVDGGSDSVEGSCGGL